MLKVPITQNTKHPNYRQLTRSYRRYESNNSEYEIDSDYFIENFDFFKLNPSLEKSSLLCSEINVIDSKFLTTNGGRSKMSVGTFAKLYDRGTYIIRVSGHAFTIKDGSVIGNPNDATQLRKVVKNAWKVG